MSLISILLVAGGIGYILVRRLIGDVLEVKGLLVLPAVLTVIGALQLRKIHPLDAYTVVFVAAGIAVSVALGLLRGVSIHLGERDGRLWMRYRASSVVLWLVNIAVKAAVIPAETALSGAAASSADHAILISIGLGLFAENAVVIMRAMHSTSVVVWAKTDDGTFVSHAGFDRAREWLNTAHADRSATGIARRLLRTDRDW